MNISIVTRHWDKTKDPIVHNPKDYLSCIIRDGVNEYDRRNGIEDQIERLRLSVAKTLVLLRENKIISDEQMFDAAGLDDWNRSRIEHLPVVKENEE